MLRHLPFFETLAGLSEGSPAWTNLTAGLLVMRLVDDRTSPDAERRRVHSWRVHAARVAVEVMPGRTAARSALAELVELIADEDADPGDLVARLAVYGHALDDEGHTAVAADVLDTVVALADAHAREPAAFDAAMRLGALYRVLGRVDDAVTAYSDAARLAAASSDAWAPTHSRLAEANVALTRGELVRAEALLEHTVAEATAPDLAVVRAAALHDRALVARALGDVERAAVLAYDALRAMVDEPARERVLVDLATLLRELGVRAAARDALLLLAARAGEAHTRWLAAVQLMELAVLDDAELVFEQHRRTLLEVELPPTLAARYSYWAGEGFRRFGRPAAARDALERARALAAQHQLAPAQQQAEAALAALDRGDPPAATAAVATPPALSGVAAGIRTLLDDARA